MIGFEFSRSLKNSSTTFQVTIRQPAMTDLIDGLTRPPIGTPSTTTWSYRLALSEMWTTKPKESAWSSVAIRNRSIPPARAERTMGPRWQNTASLNQVTLHLSLDFSTVWPQGRTYEIDQDSRSRTGAHWVIDKKCTTTSERIYSSPISGARLPRTGQHDIFIPNRYEYSIQNSSIL
jgi:hypothetical protein